MPARQLVYEGTDLQELLQRVIDEHGPARIRPPERKRRGGVLGFFAREVYVITVDVDAPESARPSSHRQHEAGDPAASFALSALPVTPADGSGPRPPSSTAAGSASTVATEPGLPAGGANGGAPPLSSPLRALVEATEDEAVLGSGGGGATDAMGGNVGTGRASGVGTENGAEPGEGSAPAGRVPLHAAPADSDKPFGEVLSEVASSLGEEPGTYRPDPERLRRGRGRTGNGRSAAGEHPVPAERGSSEQTAAPAAGEVTAEPADDLGTTPRRPGRHPVRVVPLQLPFAEVDDEEQEPPDLGSTIIGLLRAAGFPEPLLPRAPLPPEMSTVEAVFAGLPGPPPLPADPGGLVAVVGAAGMVRTAANSVALTVGCPRDEVAIASSTASDRQARPEYRARTASQAAAMGPGWRRDRVGVVAVYAPPLGSDQRWTRQMLRALRPSCVWGMAEATTKPDDVRGWAAAIGGVDALVMTDVGSTATPAAILSIGIPIARLDDEPASPARWAAVIADLVTKH